MHTKLRKKAKDIEIMIQQARKDDKNVQTVYKQKDGGQNIVDAIADKKKEEVFNFNK